MQVISLVRKQTFCREISIKNCKLNIFARNYYLGNIFVEVITIITLFASAKLSVIADCRGKFRGQHNAECALHVFIVIGAFFF